jgi:hypothetical protein
MRQPGIVYVDGDPAGYEEIKLPDNWSMVFGNGNLAGSKQFIFENYPDEACYGWVADDNHPVTPNWSYIVEEATQGWRLVHCNDQWVSLCDSVSVAHTKNLGGGICWGGELIRCVGFWAPPEIVQGGIDWFWTTLCGDSVLGHYIDDVIVRHDNWRTGLRGKDENDNLDKPHIKSDIAYMRSYLKSKAFWKIKERVHREHQIR